MQTFTISLGRGWWSRLIGRNPLVRRTDRIQAWVFALAILVIAAATSVAGAIGTSVHDARTRFYAEQAQTQHQVTATALEGSTVELGPGPADVSFFVQATWSSAGIDHVEVVRWPDLAEVGDKADIWVDGQGKCVEPAAPLGRADTDAVGIAFSVWFAVVALTVGMVYVVLQHLERRRDAGWDSEIAALDHQT